MVIAACLMFDTKYSTIGWMCASSIRQHCPYTQIYVMCLDENVHDESRYFAEKLGNLTALRLYELEAASPMLIKARQDRLWPEYVQTVKVFIPRYIFERYNAEALFYCDADSLFWTGPQLVADVLGEHSFMAVSHEIEPRPPQGTFNGGFFACREDDKARSLLTWWEDRVVEWCYWRPDDGRFADQGYLNIIEDDPHRFRGAGVCTHPGINLAHWNMRKHKVEKIGDGVFVDGEPLITFHYQDVNKQDGTHPQHGGVFDHIYDVYVERYRSFCQEVIDGLDRRRRW
jgi:hypothetical protein